MKIQDQKLRNMAHALSLSVFIFSKELTLTFLFAISPAGVVPCGGPKKSPCTSFIVQIIFYFQSSM